MPHCSGAVQACVVAASAYSESVHARLSFPKLVPMNSDPPIVVVEDDPWTRLIGVVLDPTTSQERRAAFADFMSPDEPDFAGWCEDLRARAVGLYPSEVRLVPSH